MGLANRVCVPCHVDLPPLVGEELLLFEKKLGEPWQVVNGHHLERNFFFADFQSALDFVVKVGALAEDAQHHPDLFLAWGKVRVQLWTHKIDGLHETDFILAARIEKAFNAISA